MYRRDRGLYAYETREFNGVSDLAGTFYLHILTLERTRRETQFCQWGHAVGL